MSKENEIENAVAAGIEKAFSVDAGRYIDVSRIPLICQSIVGIHTELKGLKENMEKRYVTKEGFWPVRTIVYGLWIGGYHSHWSNNRNPLTSNSTQIN